MDFSLVNLQSMDSSEDSNALFNTIRRKANLADDVIAQIEEAIIQGRLKPGDRLPTERELGKQFGVSRTVIREAMHALIARNLVDVQPGAGTVVSQPSTQAISDSLKLLLNIGRPRIEIQELVEVRLHLETEIAGLAAERRTNKDLALLEQLTDSMSQADNVQSFVRNDMAFHLALAQATQNRLYAVLLNSIIEIVVEISFQGSSSEATRERATNYHRQLLDCIRQQNTGEARKAMREHLAAFEATARRAAQGL